MRIITIILYTLLILFGVTFALLNSTPTSVNLYVAIYHLPLALLMTITFGMGLFVGLFIFFIRYWRLKLSYHKRWSLDETACKKMHAASSK